MSVRTPRRRISPRARRRYRAIRNFFRRTLSSLTSLSAIKMNSSTTENVTDLNRANTRHQLHTVPQNRRDPTSVGNLFRRHTEDLRPFEENRISNPRPRRFSDRNFEEAETKVLYKTSDNLCTNSYDCSVRIHNELNDKQHSSDRMNYEQCPSSHHVPKRKPKKTIYDSVCENFNGHGSQFRKHEARMAANSSDSDLGSYESVAIPHGYPSHPSPGHSRQQVYTRGIQPDEVKIKRRREKPKRYKSKSPHINETRRRKKKNEPPANDEQHFITDIINRQYKPLSFFGRRASDISQISTPVCRDQRFSAREMVIPDSEVSSLCQGPAPETCGRYAYADGASDMRGKTRPDTATWLPRQRRRRIENYNDSNLYDVVPVKEKTSPKSRRKFIEDTMILNEVPPSPRTHRPRLILETRNYSDYEDYEPRVNLSRRRLSPHHKRRPEYEFIHNFRRDISTEVSPRNTNNGMSPKLTKRTNDTRYKLQDDIATAMSSQECLKSPNNTTDNTLNNSKVPDQDNTCVTDKTDKALCEIKDILQHFLQELKKDSSTSQCDQASGSTNKNSAKQLDRSLHGSGNETSNALKNSAESSFNCGLGHGNVPAGPTQFVPGFANPCCYPSIIPMYGGHGMPYLVTSPSCVCASAGCGHNHPRQQTTDTQCRTCSKVNSTEENATKATCETDVLIREIYNYVAGNRNVCKKDSSKISQGLSEKSTMLPRPSVRKSMHALHQDANVGTPPLRCYSKSCEAIVSRQLFDTYYSTYPSYSDSLLEERLSQEAVLDYQMPRETDEYNFADKRKPINIPKPQHTQNSKFVSALRLLRKNNKKPRKEIHEVCQSEQSIEVDVVPKTRHNFKQEFTTYMMHGQEFLQPPPLRHDPRVPPSYDYDYSPYDSRTTRFSSPGPVSDRYNPCHDLPRHPTAPVYDHPYDAHCRHPMEPQGPLCLKEVEVRSIGIQSEGKTTRFRLFNQKKEKGEEPPERPLISILRDDRPKMNSAQKFDDTTKEVKPRNYFNANSKAAASKSEGMPSWTERLQKDITKNDKTMSNAMLSKLFYKRNPFSPQNRFVRTIMEKDTPVFKWRPRMFL